MAGDGPGQFDVPGVLGIVGPDSFIAVLDANRRIFSLFDLETGRFVRAVRFPIRDMGINWTMRGDTLVAASSMSRHLVLQWPMKTDSAFLVGELPPYLAANRAQYLSFGRPEAVVLDSEFALLIPSEPGIHFLSPTGAMRGFVPLPTARRRGTPPGSIDRKAGGAKPTQRARNPQSNLPGSAAAGFRLLSTGELAVLYLDFDRVARGDTPSSGYIFRNFRLFVSLLSSDNQRACLDAAIPIQTDVVPLPSFRGDTLIVFTRTVGDSDAVRNRFLSFLISDNGCNWVQTGGRILENQ
jgi:hypothetical protein